MNANILIIEDEVDLAHVLRDYLMGSGYEVRVAHDGQTGLEMALQNPPHLVLLDVMLPKLDGTQVLQQIRKTHDFPIIMITARSEEIDRLLGLELGADDYICKPFSPREVVTRVKAVLRRTHNLFNIPTPAVVMGGADQQNGSRAPASAEALSGSLSASTIPSAPQTESHKQLININQESWQASVQGQVLDLTPKEFMLLTIFVAQPYRVYSRSQLLDQVYVDNLDVSERAIDSHVKNLRRKLADVLPDAHLIHSVYGVGFVFDR